MLKLQSELTSNSNFYIAKKKNKKTDKKGNGPPYSLYYVSIIKLISEIRIP